MDPKIARPSDDRTFNFKATSNTKEVGFYDVQTNMHVDEDLDDIVNKISQVVLDEMIDVDNDKDLDELVKKMMKCRVHSSKNVCYDTQVLSGCSSLSMLPDGYKSKIKKIVEGYSRVGAYSVKNVSADQSAQSSRMAKIDDGDVLKRCNYMDHLNHDSSTCTSPLKIDVGAYSVENVSADKSAQSSWMAKIDDGGVLKRCKNMDRLNHDSSTCTSPLKIDDGDVLKWCKNMDHSNHDSSTFTSPLKKVFIGDIIDVAKKATLNDSLNKKRKEGTMASTNGAGRLDSKDNDRSTKKACYDLQSWSVKRSEKYKCELRKRIEEGVTKVGKYSLEDVEFDLYDDIDSPMVRIYDEDVVKRYENFKKFDIVLDHSDHLFSGRAPVSHLCTEWVKEIHEDRRILEENLPDRIFVRAYEPRKDLVRAVIIGAEGTPYHDGLFFFDLHFPFAYRRVPPVVRYHSGGLFINPNLYTSGEVCLSLPTIQYTREELWTPNTSTLLQLLVSIQDQYFTTDPLYCALGYVTLRGDVGSSHFSVLYNERTFIASLKTMVYIMNKPPKNFEAFVVGHFRNRVRDILMACKAYIEGVQVGRVVTGEGNENCSLAFRYEVTRCIKPLVAAFIKIGAIEAQEYLYLSKMRITAASAPAPTPVTKSIRMTATQSRLESTGPLCN